MLPSSSVFPYGSSGVVRAWAYQFHAGNDADEDSREPTRFDRLPAGREDLPYRVELWDQAKNAVEQVLAVTANGSIGYAAYFAATREYPDRYITLRHRNNIVTRWNGPDN
jgi:hypothetical protein